MQNREFDRRFFFRAVGVCATGLTLPGLAACSGTGRQAGNNGSGRYSGGLAVPLYTQLPDNIPLIVGLAKGFFASQKLSLNPVTFSQGSDVVRSVVTQTHLGSSSPMSGMVAHGNGFPKLRIIGACLNAPTIVYLVRPDSPIRDVSELRGKKIGVNAPTSVTTYLGRAMVKAAGLDPDQDVQLVGVKAVSDSATALENGVVDCAWSSPPLSVQLVEQGKARVLYDAASKNPDFTQTALFSDTQFIDGNVEVIQHFVNAVAKSQAFVRNNPDEAGMIWAKTLKISTQSGIATVKALASHFSIEITDAGFNHNVNAATSLGLLHGTLKRSDIVDDRFIAKARGAAS